MPAGGMLSVADAGSALTTITRVKEQIMLTGGVLASMAMSQTTFSQFVAYKTAANSIFTTNEDVSKVLEDVVMAGGTAQAHLVMATGSAETGELLQP